MEASQLTTSGTMAADERDPKPGKSSNMAEQPESQLYTACLNAYLQLHGWQAARRLWRGYWVWRIERIGEEKSL
jgi:hypothetical protein